MTNPYNHNAAHYAQRYESVAFEDVHGQLLDFIARLGNSAFVLDVGSGSGRDAAWFAAQGHEVVAVEPSHGMRTEAIKRHADTAVQWVDDSLPALAATHRLGISFDLILLSAVWMHVRPTDRARAMRKLATLLNPGGRMAITLRLGPPDPQRQMYDVSEHELDILAREHGLKKIELATASSADKLGRDDISWLTVLYELT
ncbi:class I SAM-dependent methyltransferase [Desulfurispira natronophila]|uniref:SAM-dependent methyltransferase n=1 Tax=Desulfurispira natronophila TaxID=682562 RepID=A0A7W7Y3J7_9BACT|nr:class I SAM-dependent methyltransferase [Desulfurispira natronophila]MBB5021368.1 SAM-dependent methyltransferase [Desulfurispira natronophila]